MQIQLNSKFTVDLENIQKIIPTDINRCRVYLKKGYPKIIKVNSSYINLITKIINKNINNLNN